MSELNNHYQQIIKDLKENISNENEKNFVLNKFQELSMMFMDVIDKLTNLTESRMREIDNQQLEIAERIQEIEGKVQNIENDVYVNEEPEEYEFEIVCPYCNHEFVADIKDGLNNDIECPECHNIIELECNDDENEIDKQNENVDDDM